MVAFRYEWGVKKNEAKSIEMGRPVFDDVKYCRFTHPDGDRVFEVNKSFTENFLTNKQMGNKEREMECKTLRDALKDFEENGEKVQGGYPVREWAIASRTEIAALEAQGVMTLEQLGDLDDKGCKERGITPALRDKAKEYLEAGVDSGKTVAKLAKVQEELREANETIADLKKELAKAKAFAEVVLEEKPKRKKGE
jgi:hypothetical protein